MNSLTVPWHEQVSWWCSLLILDSKCIISPVSSLVHHIKSPRADGHVPLNQHTDKWKTVNLNGLVKLAWVLIAYQASGCSSCHGGEKNGLVCQSTGSKLAACSLGTEWMCVFVCVHAQRGSWTLLGTCPPALLATPEATIYSQANNRHI